MLQEDKYVAILSGLAIGSSGQQQHMLMLDWLKGLLGGDDDTDVCRRTVRVIVAGKFLVLRCLHKVSERATRLH